MKETKYGRKKPTLFELKWGQKKLPFNELKQQSSRPRTEETLITTKAALLLNRQERVASPCIRLRIKELKEILHNLTVRKHIG